MLKHFPFARLIIAFASCLAVFLDSATSAAGAPANLLANPGFDLDAAGHSQTLLGWQVYGGNAYNETDVTKAHSPTNYFKVYQAFNGYENDTGIYQDYISGPGAIYAADGWAYVNAGDVLAGNNSAWMEITFRDANANILALYRSPSVTTNLIVNGTFPKSVWNHLFITNQFDPSTDQITNTTARLAAPAGTAFVRFQINFHGDANYSAGSVYFDDLSLTQSSGAPYGNMNIVWSDEFNSNNINPNVWTYDLGKGGWGNNELEYYTSRTNNAFVSQGYLHIVAQHESYGGASYTSARLKSQGLFSCKYGRIEWRAKLPQGVGCWPALWLLGNNITSLGWPGCGEIDVMENKGANPLQVQGSLHSGSSVTDYYNFIDGNNVTNFHTYTLDWNTNAILFYVDGHLYESRTSWSSSTSNPYPFPFNQPFFFIMNLAIGGNYISNPSTDAINAGTAFPSEMLVDYVRIYNPTEPLKIAVKQTSSSLLLTWPSNIVCHVQEQTNSLPVGLGTNWVSIPTNTNQIEVSAGSGSGYFRLVTP